MIWEGASLWLLKTSQDLAETGQHAHHAIQVTFALEGTFALCTGAISLPGPVVAVRADAAHVFRADGAVALLFVEPESSVGRALQARLPVDRDVAALTDARAMAALAGLRDCFRRNATDAELRSLGQSIARDLAVGSGAILPDARVRKMITCAQQNLDQPLSLVSAAAHANLSPSRARHLFVAHTGLPFKTYVLWLRIERAVRLYAAGRTLTEAAHEAGFADSAHFSRTFRRTFGVTAAELRLGSRA